VGLLPTIFHYYHEGSTETDRPCDGLWLGQDEYVGWYPTKADLAPSEVLILPAAPADVFPSERSERLDRRSCKSSSLFVGPTLHLYSHGREPVPEAVREVQILSVHRSEQKELPLSQAYLQIRLRRHALTTRLPRGNGLRLTPCAAISHHERFSQT